MEDLANDYAMALDKEFGGRVDVVGISTIRAEDAFDIGGRLGEISAPTLVIGGAATASTRPTCSGRRQTVSRTHASSSTRTALTGHLRRPALRQ
jgi:hypothetical protein